MTGMLALEGKGGTSLRGESGESGESYEPRRAWLHH
jgi:hypothetical protein